MLRWVLPRYDVLAPVMDVQKCELQRDRWEHRTEPLFENASTSTAIYTKKSKIGNDMKLVLASEPTEYLILVSLTNIVQAAPCEATLQQQVR